MPATRTTRSVDADWRDFFGSLKDDAARRRARARDGASWKKPNWPVAAQWRARLGARRQLGPSREGSSATRSRPRRRRSGVELSDADVQQATRDSVRALMMIRAYRMRGHLARQSRSARPRSRSRTTRSSTRASYGFTEADYDRKIFIDNVLGLEFATIREMLAILQRTYCSTLGVEFMHISDPAAEGLDPGAHRGRRQGDHLHPRGQARDPQQADRGRRLREVPRRQVHRHQALRPRRRRVADPGAGADHQARRRARREGDRARHGRIAAGSTCSRR